MNRKFLQKALKDEHDANLEYLAEAKKENNPAIVRILKEIASDERDHHRLLSEIKAGKYNACSR